MKMEIGRNTVFRLELGSRTWGHKAAFVNEQYIECKKVFILTYVYKRMEHIF